MFWLVSAAKENVQTCIFNEIPSHCFSMNFQTSTLEIRWWCHGLCDVITLLYPLTRLCIARYPVDVFEETFIQIRFPTINEAKWGVVLVTTAVWFNLNIFCLHPELTLSTSFRKFSYESLSCKIFFKNTNKKRKNNLVRVFWSWWLTLYLVVFKTREFLRAEIKLQAVYVNRI